MIVIADMDDADDEGEVRVFKIRRLVMLMISDIGDEDDGIDGCGDDENDSRTLVMQVRRLSYGDGIDTNRISMKLRYGDCDASRTSMMWSYDHDEGSVMIFIQVGLP